MKKRIFIQSVFPAPYRVEVFRKLNEVYDIFVVFERDTDNNRSENWFTKKFGFKAIVLDNNIKLYNEELKKLKTYDAVLAYDYSSLSSVKLMLKCMRLKVPYLVNCDGAFINNHLIKDFIKSFFISNSKGCLASGSHAQKYFLEYGAQIENIFFHNFSSLNKEDILQNPLTIDEKNKIKIKLGLPTDKNIVLSVGQFTFRKGYDILLKAWKLLDDHDSLLVLVGGGEKEQEYRDFIKNNRMDNVIIEGFKSKNTIFDFYKASSLFVLPTREDIWGLVINEAMACGLPVITTEKCVAGLELIENKKNGFIIPIENDEKLAESVRIILENDELCYKMGCENLTKIRPYNIENISDSHIQTLNQILGGI